MIPASLPENEDLRLEKLYELNILDTLEEQAYDDITHLIAQICDVPIALISLIDKDRQFLKSHHGLDANEVSRELGFCPHAILDNDVTVIEDATKDERFHDNPLVTGGPQVKFYAGAPLIMPGDLRIGTLCIVANEPRTISEDQKKALEVLARQVVSQLELRETVERLEIASRSKSDFLSSMSHELRTPMNAILGFGQLLELNPSEPLTENQKRCVEQIMKGGHHLLELINDVLDLTKIEEGKVDLSIEEITVSNILDECFALIETIAGSRGVTVLTNAGCKTTATVHADYTRFKQSLLNLLSNAVKYNVENGKIIMDCHETTDDMLRISVTDTGLGIPNDMLAVLYEPFNRLRAEKSEIEGTGIGLTITKKLIERMHGRIGVESQVGTGSTFWIELPLAQPAAYATPANDTDASRHEYAPLAHISGSVLYVEDNPSNLQLMEMILGSIEGLSLMTAHTGELGLQIAKTSRPDLIILDINLPGLNGFEVLKALQQMSETKDTPVFALSANTMPRDIDKGLDAGFKQYLTKPFKVPEIISAIQGVLNVKAL